MDCGSVTAGWTFGFWGTFSEVANPGAEDVCQPEDTVPGNYYCPSNFFTITMLLVTIGHASVPVLFMAQPWPIILRRVV